MPTAPALTAPCRLPAPTSGDGPVLVVVAGLPGSSKTTQLRRHAARWSRLLRDPGLSDVCLVDRQRAGRMTVAEVLGREPARAAPTP